MFIKRDFGVESQGAVSPMNVGVNLFYEMFCCFKLVGTFFAVKFTV